MSAKLGFIGAGNMAKAIIGGLISHHYPTDLLYASDPAADKLAQLKKHYAIHTFVNNTTLVQQVDSVILAVKPQVLPQVVQTLALSIQQRRPLVISIAAGVTVATLANRMGHDIAIIRCMPNMPALLQAGISGLYANQYATPKQCAQAERILQAVGKTLWVKNEDDINKITAVSGSGPAYFFYFMEALQAAAQTIGLESSVARELSLQTALGAARLANESTLGLAQLRQTISSPGGTTVQALQHMETHQVKQIMTQAVVAALKRARELAR